MTWDRSNLDKFRNGIGNTPIMGVAEKINWVLRRNKIPYIIAGGLAVQELGWVRYTQDIDLIVENLDLAKSSLISFSAFDDVGTNGKKLIHLYTKIEVNLLESKPRSFSRGEHYPVPIDDGKLGIQFATPAQLINVKLSSKLLRDRVDIIELIKINKWSFDEFDESLTPEVIAKYWNACDQAYQELEYAVGCE